jgi:hypothetical protein
VISLSRSPDAEGTLEGMEVEFVSIERLPFVEVETVRIPRRASSIIWHASAAPLIAGQEQIALHVPHGRYFAVRASKTRSIGILVIDTLQLSDRSQPPV